MITMSTMSENYTTIATIIRKDRAEKFKRLCNSKGITPCGMLRSYVHETLDNGGFGHSLASEEGNLKNFAVWSMFALYNEVLFLHSNFLSILMNQHIYKLKEAEREGDKRKIRDISRLIDDIKYNTGLIYNEQGKLDRCLHYLNKNDMRGFYKYFDGIEFGFARREMNKK